MRHGIRIVEHFAGIHDDFADQPVLQKQVERVVDRGLGGFGMAVIDCGRPINPALARIQAEGGIVQGIGMALMENVTYNSQGRPAENSF